MKAIAGNSIDAWLERLAREAEVFVPTRSQGGDVILAPLALGEGQAERVVDYIRLAESPKRIFMPQMDDLVRFEKNRGEAVLDAQDRILFGLRPCDAAAIAILDEFFSRDYPDPHYLARRSSMRLIVAACPESQESCFCISTQTGPVAINGFDVQLFDLGEIHLAQVGSEEGQKLIEQGGELFSDPGDDAERRLDEFRRKAEASQQVRLDLSRVREIIRSGSEGEDFWEKVADRCFMCGGCAYLCPTCSCYNIADVATAAGEGLRQRLWDTCVLGGFTREASGHNPRERQSTRCAFRYLHKLGGPDSVVRPIRCVGCGRCVNACISRLGMIRVVQELLEAD